MSSNSFTWVTEGGDLGTADWVPCGRRLWLVTKAH